MLPLCRNGIDREVKALAVVIESKIPTANVQELKMYVFAYRAIRWQTQDADSQPQFKETSNKLTDLIISSMENKQASLTLKDLQEYPIILMSLQDTMSKDCYSRLATIGEKSSRTYPTVRKRDISREPLKNTENTLVQNPNTKHKARIISNNKLIIDYYF